MSDIIELLSKYYSAESLCDMDRDVAECLDKDFNPTAELLPDFDNDFGEYHVSICYIPKGADDEM